MDISEELKRAYNILYTLSISDEWITVTGFHSRTDFELSEIIEKLYELEKKINL